jgi:Derlin-2/3
VVLPNADRHSVLPDHVVLNHRRVRVRGERKHFFFFFFFFVLRLFSSSSSSRNETKTDTRPLFRRKQVISPFSVYFNSNLVFREYQLWRLITNFFFFGALGLDFIFHMFFLARYCRMLEEGTFRGKSADFFWMLMFGASLLTMIAPFVNVQFLGSSLTFMMVYVWGRKNENVNMSFLGLFSFTAPYLPWVLLAFSTFLGSSPVVDLLGCAVGHLYFFLWSVYPEMTGRRVVKTPKVVKFLFRENVGSDVNIRLAGRGFRGEDDEEQDERGVLRRAGVIFGQQRDEPRRANRESSSDSDEDEEQQEENDGSTRNTTTNSNEENNSLRRREIAASAAENRRREWYDE